MHGAHGVKSQTHMIIDPEKLPLLYKDRWRKHAAGEVIRHQEVHIKSQYGAAPDWRC